MPRCRLQQQRSHAAGPSPAPSPPRPCRPASLGSASCGGWAWLPCGGAWACAGAAPRRWACWLCCRARVGGLPAGLHASAGRPCPLCCTCEPHSPLYLKPVPGLAAGTCPIPSLAHLPTCLHACLHAVPSLHSSLQSSLHWPADYDLEGAQGVGSKGGLAVARYLLRGGAAAGQGEPQEDDSEVLERLAELVQVCGCVRVCAGVCLVAGSGGGRWGAARRSLHPLPTQRQRSTAQRAMHACMHATRACIPCVGCLIPALPCCSARRGTTCWR